MEAHRRPSRMLVLWKWNECENWQGQTPTASVGGHMKYARRGDVLYVCAISDREVYLLGSLFVNKVGRERRWTTGRGLGAYVATGKSRWGEFGAFPLGSLKWRVRFESTESDRLARTKPLGMQLRSRRYLTTKSARLFDEVLKKRRELRRRNVAAFRVEGKRVLRAMSVRERDPRVRRDAIRRYGRLCNICGIDLTERYGRFAAECVEVHHLDPIGERGGRGSRTVLDEVIVVCPNCHRALHAFDDPAAWRRLKAAYGLNGERD